MRPRKESEQKQKAAREEFSHECTKFGIMSSDDKYKTLTTSHYMQEMKTQMSLQRVTKNILSLSGFGYEWSQNDCIRDCTIRTTDGLTDLLIG